LSFSTPTAHWSVVEECSGINYLIASVVIGVLYTYLTYRSTLRRVVFVGLFVLIPLLANGIRAYLIVLLAYLTNNRLATGVDHIWLGWVLFGVVMLLMFWAASFWREDELATTSPQSPSPPPAASTTDSRVFIAVAATILVVSVWRPAAAWVDNAVPRQPVQLSAIADASGWSTTGAQLVNWEPDYVNFSSRRFQVFTKGGEDVGVSIMFYRNQGEHRKLITSTNQLVKSGSPRWRVATSGRTETAVGKERLRVKTTEFTDGSDRIVAWHWYRVGGRLTASDILAKVYIALSKLSGQGDDSALVVIYTRKKDRSGSESRVLADFAAGMGEAVQRTLSDVEAR
jgi:EpsI family protein